MSMLPLRIRRQLSTKSSSAAAAAVTAAAAQHQRVAPMLRVDHAGEVGADKIYEGQVYVLGNSDVGGVLRHMWEQEKAHRAEFDRLLAQHRVRPTLLHPVWQAAGFALGAGTALLGKEAAMACTEAVETVISEHYNDQLRELLAAPAEDQEKLKPLIETIRRFRDDELAHHDTAVEHDARKAPMYNVLNQVIQAGCRAAIWTATRL